MGLNRAVRAVRAARAAGLLVVALGAALSAQPARTAVDVTKLGPQVGQAIPDFSLTDQAGKAWTRQSIMGPKGAMVVFFRSADW